MVVLSGGDGKDLDFELAEPGCTVPSLYPDDS
jgi:hypothetical protein